MDSRFAHLRQRDTSVSMLRVKMSRRRSQSQKENRERAVNTRRQLAKLQELEMSSLDASIMANMSTIQEKTLNNAKSAKSVAVEERLKQLDRWKERKALEKEKEKRERERKGVFKTGMFHPKDTLTIPSLPVVPAALTRAKETKVNTAPSQNARVTRSMKQQQVQRTVKVQDTNTAGMKAQPAVERSTRTRVKPTPGSFNHVRQEPAVRALSTRSANRPPVTAAPVVKDKPKHKSADVRTTRSRAFVSHVAPPSDQERNSKATVATIEPAMPMEPELMEPEMQETEDKPLPPSPAPCSEEEGMAVDQAPADSLPAADPVEASSSLSSFAPEGFKFQAPTGLSSFKLEPLTPRSADAFLTPSPSFILPEVPAFNVEPQAEPSKPSPSVPRTSPTMAPPTPGIPLESKHDVLYFRSEIANETDRLTTLSVLWEAKVEDESIPEEMRDCMRTAVGQARLLMKERFTQFSGLVDDCDLGRGERIITCTDLQGFWDMVYYQVEDVHKKFNTLKEAESRGWVEEHKPPPPRQRKGVKKQSAAPAKPTGTKVAAKSRLAAVKAAMKARQQAENAAKEAGNDQAEPQPTDAVVFDGGFFQVESPARPSVVSVGSARRSSRRSAAVLPQASPCSSYLSPRRVSRRSLALAQVPLHAVASPAQPVHTPAHISRALNRTPAQTPKSQRGTPQSSQKRKDPVNVSLCFSPVKEALSDDSQPETVPAQEDVASVPDLSAATPVRSLPSISVVEEQDEPAEAVDVDLPLSPRLSLSPCKPTPAVSQAPEPPSLSFMLSPCVTPSQPTISFPTAVEAQESVCHTPDSSVVEEIPGLDFERYFQPSQRCSLSPRETVALDMLSPMAADVEMESPRAQSEPLLTQQEPGSLLTVATAHPVEPSVLMLQSPKAQTAESMLFFTPDLKDRIRQSVCPSDLMVFTPPL
ncbi:disks large-associated protein 5 isoform X2 [Perca flavescens]|uniref:disks large-associated protein 5 isoform X2 n=1 Tax=Perca flavescens TaxID=8167 RepID=UPI00106E67E1|nr:disks large-associated protein 5 isoform X2 [Perca flavescens]